MDFIYEVFNPNQHLLFLWPKLLYKEELGQFYKVALIRGLGIICLFLYIVFLKFNKPYTWRLCCQQG